MQTFLDGVFLKLKELFSPDRLGTQFAELLANAVVGLIVFLSFYFVWRLIHMMLRPVLRRGHFDETAIAFIETLTKYGILIVAVINALNAAGIQTSAVLASLGIAGLTIGFAARDALSNIISGILIFLDRPFVIGDLVEIEGEYGRVDRITLRSTRIVTLNGRMLAVPNTQVINTTIASYTNFPHLRIDIRFTVGVKEDFDRIREILLPLVRDNDEYMSDPAPRVVVIELNDFNITLELQAWLKDERRHIENRFALREQLYSTLLSNGVDMPYETLQLTPIEIRDSSKEPSLSR